MRQPSSRIKLKNILINELKRSMNRTQDSQMAKVELIICMICPTDNEDYQ